MNFVSGLTSRRFLQQGALLRALSATPKCFFSSESDGDNARKNKTKLSSLLGSLSGRKLNVENVLQKESKPRKQSQVKSSKRQDGLILEYKSAPEEMSSLEGGERNQEAGTSKSIKATMSRVYRAKNRQQVSPEMNEKLKSVLSNLKLDASKSQLSKDIVGAVKTWGRVSPRSRDIENDFNMQSKPEPTRTSQAFSLTFGAKLDLFDDVFDGKTSTKETLPSLKLLEGEDMELLEKQKSLDQRNDFVTLIEMSDKQWKFPVDNELCKVEEKGVEFEEHVFLSHLLDNFPKKGPVRRFMELIVNGLEQNPYMSLDQKKKQVMWFEEYFDNIPEEDLSF